MDVLVTGAEEKQGLTVARSLGRKGLRVLLGGSEKHSIGFYSKYAYSSFVYPSPYDDIEAYVNSILDNVKKYSIPIIFPSVESTLVCLDRYRDVIEKESRLAAPPSDLLQLAIDKTKTIELAKSLGVPVPRTIQVNSMESAIQAGRELGYPLAMKPQGSRFHKKLPGKLKFKVAYASSESDLKSKLDDLCRDGVFPIMQEFSKGMGICVAAVISNGEPLTLFQYKRCRELPITGGVSVVREGMTMDPTVNDYCIRMLKAMNWSGPAMVEFKFNPVTNQFTLMEINSRIQSSIALAYYSGLDIPYMVYELFMNGKKIYMTNYKTGVRCRWLRGDIESIKRYWSGDTTRKFITGDDVDLPKRSTLFWDFIKDFRPGTKYDIESFSDPLPGLVELKRLGREQAGSIFHFIWK